MSEVDCLAGGQGIFKWDQYKPSAFFSRIRENLMMKYKKGVMRSPSANVHSPRRKGRRSDGEDDLLLDLKMESE
jgi:CRISPR/Cas system endoribonuclease Cas6 (RAMP superfamily)